MLAQSIIHALSLEETDRRPCDMESKLWAAINRYDRLAQNNDHRKNNEEERARLFKLLRDFLCENNKCSGLDKKGKAKYMDDYHLRPTYVKNHVRYLDQTVT